MTGRTGLTWVTALTVASLLLGGGALNALAEERRGGHGGGGEQGNSGHQQRQKPTMTHLEDGKSQTATQPTVKHDNDGVERKRNDDDNTDKDDLVTKPGRVTDKVRPGMHCDDDCNNHDDGEDMTTGVVDNNDDN